MYLNQKQRNSTAKFPRLLAFICIITVSLVTGCLRRETQGAPDPPEKTYPPVGTTTVQYRWLVVKCQLNDVPSIPSTLNNDIDKFLTPAGVGTGNIEDYFAQVSYNQMKVVGVTTPWVTAPFGTTNLPGRFQRVQQCTSAVPASQMPSLDGIYGIIVVNNVVQDGGACSIGQTTMSIRGISHQLACIWFDPNSLKIEFAAHEIGHGFGLNHSYDDSGRNCSGPGPYIPGQYCDPWDIMSAQGTYQFVDKQHLVAGAPSGAGPGMNAVNLFSLDLIPKVNVRLYESRTPEQTFQIRALSHARTNEPLVVFVETDDPDPTQNAFTVEYRQADGWDYGFSTDLNTPQKVRTSGGVVLVHHYNPKGAPTSSLINGAFSGAMQPCDTLVLGNQNRFVHVNSFNIADGSASITVGSGGRKFFPCFRNILTHEFNNLVADVDDDSALAPSPNQPSGPRPPIFNPPPPRSGPVPPR